MRLKTKLWISFGSIIIIPLVLVMLAGKLLISYQLNVINTTYNINADIKDIFPSSTRLFSRLAEQIQEKIKAGVADDVDKFEDPVYLEQFCDELRQQNIYLMVRKGDAIIFTSDSSLQAIYNELPEYGDLDEGFINAKYLGGDEPRLIKAQDLIFSDGIKGTVFVAISINSWIPELKMMAVELIVLVVLILIITAAFFVFWIYRSIVKPLDILKDAVKNIKEGNLDFIVEVPGNEDDEMGQLCIGFEEMRQRLKESSEEKVQMDAENKELISNISHDLKTPITAIKGYVEGLKDGVADTPEKMNRYIQTIYNKANDMDRLINELTFYSKIDTNRIPYTFSKLNVSDYFGDCAEEVGLDLEAQNIIFGYYNYCDESVMIIADAEQLKRVINNVISNSVKYFDKSQGQINIRIKDVGDFIQVEIEDNGKGIAQKDLPYIFDRFYRTDSSRNSAKGGSGIGLSIVKKIIEDHGGKIWASSKEGTGTVMNFVVRKYQEVTDE